MPGFPSHRRTLVLAALAAALLIAAYAGYWFFLARELRDGFKTFQLEQARALVTVEARDVRTGGFPGDLTLSLNAPALHRRGVPDYAWAAQGLRLTLSPFRPTKGHVETVGAGQSFAFHDTRAGVAVDLTARAGAGDFALLGFGGALKETHVAIEGLAGRVRLPDMTAAAPFSAEQVDVTLVPGQFAQGGELQRDAVLTLTGCDVMLPEEAGEILGRSLSYAAIEATFTGGKGGPFTLDALGRDGVRALRTFFEGDGRLEIAHLAVKWGNLDATARGALKLDVLHRLEGTLHVEASGYRDVLDGLVRQGTLTRDNAQTIGGALDLLAALRRDPKGAVAAVLIFQKGKLFVGPLEVARLKPLF